MSSSCLCLHKLPSHDSCSYIISNHVGAYLQSDKHGACAEHDCGVFGDERQAPRGQCFDHLSQKRVLRGGRKEVVGEANWAGGWHDEGVGQQVIEWQAAFDVKIQVEAAVLMQQHIPGSKKIVRNENKFKW